MNVPITKGIGNPRAGAAFDMFLRAKVTYEYFEFREGRG